MLLLDERQQLRRITVTAAKLTSGAGPHRRRRPDGGRMACGLPDRKEMSPLRRVGSEGTCSLPGSGWFGSPAPPKDVESFKYCQLYNM